MAVPSSFILSKGQLFGQEISTHVDHEMAQAILENYPNSKPGPPLGPPLASTPTSTPHLTPNLKLKRFLTEHDSCPLNADTLGLITSKYSLDTATFYFLNRLYNQVENKRLQDLYLDITKTLRQDNLRQEKDTDLVSLQNYYVAFVPGFGYLEDKTTGADFARQRALLSQKGINNELIEIEEWGVVQRNADIIKARIQALKSKHPKVILVSTSKGGLETALALSQIPPSDTDHISHWISVGGILKGSPLADGYLSFPKSLLAWFILKRKGQPKAFVEQLSYAYRKEAFDQIKIPQHVKILHFVGAPLAHAISERIYKRHKSMLQYGPNDGLTPLPDQLLSGGHVVSEIGLDHYFVDDEIDLKTLALALVAIEM